jgi:hypothetical protein
MSIANPSTYAEWWWQQQVDANKTFADAEEQSLAPLLQSLASMVTDLEGFPPAIIAMFNAVGTTGHFGLASVAKETLAQGGNQSISAGLSPFLRSLGYAANKKFPSALIDIPTAVTLAHRRKIIPELFASRIAANGLTEAEARMFYDVAAPYPDMISLMQWARYTTDDTGTFTKLQSKMDIPDDEFTIWEFLSQLRLTTGDIQALFVREYMDKDTAKKELIRDGFRTMDADAMLDLAYTIPNATIVLQDGLFKESTTDDLTKALTIAGIHPDYVSTYINAVLSKPNPSDMIRWRLRTDPNLTDLDKDLRKLGVHPDYMQVFKDLSYPVPPVGDMITMAVREAFTPDIAARFGQYDDYPADLTKFAAMNGISEEWTKRYWAAHWTLPSPQQGFAMFQRGIVTREELNLLLRALDIMPFWREKLTQLAYNPLTRVDVRRMYALGVLSEEEVEKAYKDAGYSDENARRLRAFVVKDTIRSQSGMSVSKIVTAYKNGLTDRNSAFATVSNLGVRPQNVSDILEAAEKQLQWQQTKDAIAAIGNQYKEEILTEQHARDALVGLRLSGDKVNNLIARWKKDGIEAHATLWTKADVVSMLKKKLITEGRASQELGLLGFNAERTQVLIRLATV